MAKTKHKKIAGRDLAPASPAQAAAGGWGGLGIAVAACVLLAGITVRVAGIFTDFWLDEIWSWTFVRDAGSALDILRTRHDNNHLLNTLCMYVLGADADWRLYRLFALACGIGTVLMMGVIARRTGRAQALVTVVLASMSYALVLYSSEARGYAPVLFFMLICYWLMDRWGDRGGWPAAAFSLSAVLALLSHLTFVYPYAGMLAWSAWHIVQHRDRRAQQFFILIQWHTVPLMALALLNFFFLRGMSFGGLPDPTIPQALAELLGQTLGTPTAPGPASYAVVAIVLVLLLVETMGMWRRGSAQWVFCPVAMFLAPLVVLGSRGETRALARYFLVFAPFVLLVLGRALGRSYGAGKVGRVVCVLTVTGLCIGNAAQVYELLADGRGHYGDAVQHMAEHTPGTEITVGADHEFRAQRVLEYYQRFSPKPVRFVSQQRFSAQEPVWIIVHATPELTTPPLVLPAKNHRDYILSKTFESSPAGFTWFVYQMK